MKIFTVSSIDDYLGCILEASQSALRTPVRLIVLGETFDFPTGMSQRSFKRESFLAVADRIRKIGHV